MEQEKNKNGVIALLVVIIVILLTLVVLLATGNINFQSTEVNNGSDENSKVTDNNNEIANDNNGNNYDENKFKLQNDGVEEKDLNEVFDILGLYEYYHHELYSSFNTGNECLNYYISDNNYKNNSKKIFAWYINLHNMGTNTGQTAKIRDIDGDGKADIDACGGAADCGSIRISDANKVIKLYGLTGLSDELKEMPEPYRNAEYLINYYSLSGMHPITCNIKTNHNVSVKYSDNKNIVITDEQTVTEYGFFEETEQIKSQKKQSVTYDLKKDTDGNYYLNNVIVK